MWKIAWLILIPDVVVQLREKPACRVLTQTLKTDLPTVVELSAECTSVKRGRVDKQECVPVWSKWSGGPGSSPVCILLNDKILKTGACQGAGGGLCLRGTDSHIQRCGPVLHRPVSLLRKPEAAGGRRAGGRAGLRPLLRCACVLGPCWGAAVLGYCWGTAGRWSEGSPD